MQDTKHSNEHKRMSEEHNTHHLLRIRKKVYRVTYAYMGSILICGLMAAVVSPFDWGIVFINALLYLFGAWSLYVCNFFSKSRKVFKLIEVQPLSAISWGMQRERILGSALLAFFSFFIGVCMTMYLIFLQ